MRAGIWALLAFVVYLSVIAVNLYFTGAMPPSWLRIGEYFVFSVLLLGFLARWRPSVGTVAWRPIMLIMTSVLAAAEVSAWSRLHALPFSIDQWMASLIGPALVAILARYLPAAVLRAWLLEPDSRRLPVSGGGG